LSVPEEYFSHFLTKHNPVHISFSARASISLGFWILSAGNAKPVAFDSSSL